MNVLSKKTWLPILLLVCATAWAATESDSSKSVCILPGELQWKENPRIHGLQTAAMIGDPAKNEPYAQRIRFPAHFRLEPHWHPNEARMVVVLSGTLYFAFGDTFDESKLKALPPGAFFTEPKDTPHYALTKDEEVVLQLNAVGPDGTTYVKSEPAQ